MNQTIREIAGNNSKTVSKENPGQSIEVSNALEKMGRNKKTALLQFSKEGAGRFDFGSRKLSASLLAVDGRFVLVPQNGFFPKESTSPFFQRQQFCEKIAGNSLRHAPGPMAHEKKWISYKKKKQLSHQKVLSIVLSVVLWDFHSHLPTLLVTSSQHPRTFRNFCWILRCLRQDGARLPLWGWFCLWGAPHYRPQ